MYFGLNFDFDVSKNLKFYSTIAMSKFFNNEGRTEGLGTNTYVPYQISETGSYGYSGSTPKVDRAFASYEFDTVPLTLAVGRMPTNNGPPMNQLDGLPRSGTYPRFAFNAIFDGIAGVYDFSNLLPKDNSFKIRAFYQPFTNIDTGDRTKQFVDGEKINSSTPEYVILNEYALNSLGPVAQRLDVMYMHAQWHNYYTGYYSAPGALGAAMTGIIETGSDDAVYIGLEDIAHKGLNISWSGLLYKAKDSNLPDVDKESRSYLVDINQTLAGYHNVILGFEYLHTELYHYLDEWTRLNLIPFGTLQNSEGRHFYLAIPLEKKMSARLGYYQMVSAPGDYFQTERSDSFSYYAELRISL